jgi:HAD superfamily hydrolase (TIGR01509 family)
LRNYFLAFFSSCYLGAQKPEEKIYQAALEIGQRQPEESVFVDDRPLNLEAARRLRLHTLQFHDAAQLEQDLRTCGLEF